MRKMLREMSDFGLFIGPDATACLIVFPPFLIGMVIFFSVYPIGAQEVETLPAPKGVKDVQIGKLLNIGEDGIKQLNAASKRLGYSEDELTYMMIAIANGFSKEEKTTYLVVWDSEKAIMRPIFIRRENRQDVELALKKFERVHKKAIVRIQRQPKEIKDE